MAAAGVVPAHANTLCPGICSPIVGTLFAVAAMESSRPGRLPSKCGFERTERTIPTRERAQYGPRAEFFPRRFRVETGNNEPRGCDTRNMRHTTHNVPPGTCPLRARRRVPRAREAANSRRGDARDAVRQHVPRTCAELEGVQDGEVDVLGRSRAGLRPHCCQPGQRRELGTAGSEPAGRLHAVPGDGAPTAGSRPEGSALETGELDISERVCRSDA